MLPPLRRLFPAGPQRAASSFVKRGASVLLLSGEVALLAGCGGGGDDSVDLNINAVVAGRPLPTVFVPGTVGTIDILAGQSIQLDANEPVDWAFSVAGSPLFASGTSVFFNGLRATETAASPSRVVVDTAVAGPFLPPVVIRLDAVSTIDAAQVAVIDLVVH